MKKPCCPTTTAYYEIRVQGHLQGRKAAFFEGMEIILLPNGETLLRGWLPDQAALFGVLLRIRDLGIPLLWLVKENQPPPSTFDG